MGEVSVWRSTAAGALLGALFGVGFGALASVFDGGPTLVQGITESWAWFCAVGAAIGFGVARARHADRDRPGS